MLKKLLIVSILLVQTASVLAYDEVDCNVNPEFAKNSCNQCFTWDQVVENKVYWFFNDAWVNKSNKDMVMFKIEQTMPTFLSLNWTKIELEPKDANFWEYTNEFEALNNKDLEWYVLKAWEKVTWLKSSDWAWVKFSNLPNKSQEAGMLIYDLVTYPIFEWKADTQIKEPHKECVLFTSWEDVVWTPIKELKTPEDPKFEENKKVTEVQSWPGEMAIFIIFTLILSLFILNRRVVLEKIRK